MSDLPFQIGKYQLTHLIGAGGFGEVYVATDTTLQRQVAIKLLHKEISNQTFADRFLNEARLTSQLTHPNTLTIYDFGQNDGRLFLVSELLRGESLRDRLASRGALTPAEILRLFIPICYALEEAHSQGIIHRDLKPDNLFIDRKLDEERLVLLDFGIAKSGGDVKLTQTGQVFGTPHYMAPEQIRESKQVTARADLYSLGIIFYETLTGSQPYHGESLFEVFEQHVHAPIPLLSTQEAKHLAPFDALIQGLLAKNPHERIGSAREIAVFLKSIEAMFTGEEADHSAPQQWVVQASRSPEDLEPTLNTIENSHSITRSDRWRSGQTATSSSPSPTSKAQVQMYGAGSSLITSDTLAHDPLAHQKLKDDSSSEQNGLNTTAPISSHARHPASELIADTFLPLEGALAKSSADVGTGHLDPDDLDLSKASGTSKTSSPTGSSRLSDEAYLTVEPTISSSTFSVGRLSFVLSTLSVACLAFFLIDPQLYSRSLNQNQKSSVPAHEVIEPLSSQRRDQNQGQGKGIEQEKKRDQGKGSQGQPAMMTTPEEGTTAQDRRRARLSSQMDSGKRADSRENSSSSTKYKEGSKLHVQTRAAVQSRDAKGVITQLGTIETSYSLGSTVQLNVKLREGWAQKRRFKVKFKPRSLGQCIIRKSEERVEQALINLCKIKWSSKPHSSGEVQVCLGRNDCQSIRGVILEDLDTLLE